MQIAFVQFNMSWEDKDKNLRRLDATIEALRDEVDLLVLPEMFSTGFTMNASALAEETEGTTFLWMKQWAVKKEIAITGTFIVQEGTHFYNRCYFFYPDGHYEKYDKQHLFTLGQENLNYQAGNQNVVLDYMGWRICLMICYDLRFPGLLRSALPFDMVIYMASWPAKRVDAWSTLLKARAIENQSYVLGVNRIGEDGNGVPHNGQSALYDPMGACVFTANEEEGVHYTKASLGYLNDIRKSLPFLADRDRITVG